MVSSGGRTTAGRWLTCKAARGGQMGGRGLSNGTSGVAMQRDAVQGMLPMLITWMRFSARTVRPPPPPHTSSCSARSWANLRRTAKGARRIIPSLFGQKEIGRATGRRFKAQPLMQLKVHYGAAPLRSLPATPSSKIFLSPSRAPATKSPILEY
jgi:hypothetical protein